MEDYAVVVGVARYPELSAEGAAADLDGPDNDAQDVYDWLVSPDGGRLDPGNVKLLRSGDFEPPEPGDPQPAEAKIELALKWVEQQTRQTGGGRLYLYFSGHGFSPDLEEGALFTAEATQISPSYVYAHAWLRWFRKAQRFREAVLWMDCCMDFQQSIPVQEVLMRPQLGTSVPGPVFIGLAAHTKKALERKMPDGKVHGVFTWTLLKGLSGGASDERGQVTAESLRSFLYAVMPEFMPEDARSAGLIDLQPFVRSDQGMVFRVLPDRPKCQVHLTVPDAAADQELTIWTGRPPRRVVSETLNGTGWTGGLVRGLYVAELPAAGFRQGFQVSGAGDLEVAVTRHGEPVVPSDGSELFTLDVHAANPAASVSVMDYQFNRIVSATGELHVRDMPGVYKVRVELGRDITTISDEVVLLDRNQQLGAATSLASPELISGTARSPEVQTRLFTAASTRPGAFTGPALGKGAISVVSRYWTAADTPTVAGSMLHPMQGLRLVTRAGKTVAELTRECTVDEQTQVGPLAVWERELKPGPYFLRQALPGGRTYEGCIIAAPDWVTQIAVRLPDPTAVGLAPLGAIGDAAVSMRRAGGTADPDQDETIEAARMALSQSRNLFAEGRGTQLQALLLEKYNDPVAGIIGCHLLLRALVPQPDPALQTSYDQAVANLRSLVGPDQPDVEALSLKCADESLRATRPFTVPPMFSHSWQLITDASYGRPELVPLELWQRVHATGNVGPFFVWAVDKKTKAAHAAQLSEWIAKYAAPGTARRRPASARALPKAAREDARRMQVPAAATTALWRRHADSG
ncbi:MAG: caspase family protein [Microbacterium sp.]